MPTAASGSGSEPTATFPVPAYSESPYLNVGTEARYIGTAACAECHRSNHDSYLHTAHSRALSDLDPGTEPPDGTFHHKASGRSYRIYRKDGQFRHEEVLRTAEGKEIARVDHPIRYLIGSGHFCRSYLVEVDGFIHQSPVTWYTSRKAWDMSPGYDFPHHWGFERPVKVGCLACHAGRVEALPGSVHKVAFHEKAIGCESCHGPGSRHAERHRTAKHPSGEDDFTIVNPGKLSRPLFESVCGACHLNGPATIFHRGRQPSEYRPGRPLTDYRTDYRFDSGSEKMTVVGHIEQLRASACYQKSDLTCLTCHDPHAREKPKDPAAYHRQKCLDCHADRGCSVPVEERTRKQPADNCAACHMPRGDTDIPHVAFTHHRIGRHTAAAPASTRIPELIPTDEAPHLSTIDRQRNLGLAYLEVSNTAETPQLAMLFRDRARELLEGVRAAGLRDGAAAEALAELSLGQDPARVRTFANESLEDPTLWPEIRGYSLTFLANTDLEDRDPASAIKRLEELVRIRRFSEDWRLLGVAHLVEGRPREAVTALNRAMEIRPYRHDVHRALADAYRRVGDQTRARQHLETADWLLKHEQE